MLPTCSFSFNCVQCVSKCSLKRFFPVNNASWELVGFFCFSLFLSPIRAFIFQPLHQPLITICEHVAALETLLFSVCSSRLLPSLRAHLFLSLESQPKWKYQKCRARTQLCVHNVRRSVGHVELYIYPHIDCLGVRMSFSHIHLHLARHGEFVDFAFERYMSYLKMAMQTQWIHSMDNWKFQQAAHTFKDKNSHIEFSFRPTKGPWPNKKKQSGPALKRSLVAVMKKSRLMWQFQC